MKKRDLAFYFNDISKYRTYLMGVATLLVALKHSRIVFDSLIYSNSVLSKIGVILFYFRYLGHIGVDIFLFVSAIGLYYAFSKNENILYFYKRRLQRIMPLTLLYLIGYRVLINGYSIVEVPKILSGYTLSFTGDREAWYIAYTIVLHLAFPFLYKAEKKYGRKIYLILIGIVVMNNYLYSIIDPFHFEYIEVALRRTPIFLFGCYCFKYVKENIVIKNKLFLAISVVVFAVTFFGTIIGYESNLELWSRIDRYVGSIYALSLIVLSIYIAKLTENKVTHRFVDFNGVLSLEIYLCYESVFKYEQFAQCEFFAKNVLLGNIVCLLVTYMFVYIIKIMFNVVENKKPIYKVLK